MTIEEMADKIEQNDMHAVFEWRGGAILDLFSEDGRLEKTGSGEKKHAQKPNFPSCHTLFPIANTPIL